MELLSNLLFNLSKKNITFFIFSCFLFIHCKKTVSPTSTDNIKNSAIKYAKGFNIIKEGNQKKLIIKKVFQGTSHSFTFLLNHQNSNKKNNIKIPIEKVVVTSTTHIPMLELLNVEESLIGFPHTRYISSKKTRVNIDRGKIMDLGMEQDINVEKLLDLQPDLVVGFSIYANNKIYENIEKSGIPVIFNGDWLEETPLGRAEWIKFFGALYNKEKQADSIFSSIEKEYLKAKKIAKRNTNSPTVLSGSMFKDVWNVPAGESYYASFFKDAYLNYLWKDTKGSGSIPLSFEQVLEKAKHADYWIKCGFFSSKEQILNASIHYQELNALKNDQVYTITHKKGATGGHLFFELSTVRPDLVLKDLIKITQPDLLPAYELSFFSKVN